jgi:hypothetical protein
MAQYKVFWKASTREVKVMADAASTPSGFVLAGTFNHDDDAADGLHYHGNHAVYHHVRGVLYRYAPSDIGLQNMQTVSITFDGVTIAPPT